MKRDAMRRLAAANPVVQPPLAPDAERLRRLIESEQAHEPRPASATAAAASTPSAHDRTPARAQLGHPHSANIVARASRLRLPALAFVALLATATIALAATGVILSGAPVRPEEALNPAVGEGLPAPGAAQLLPLRVSDPEGGPPWGMRVVRTTRGEQCLQIGRVQDGQLGELGIDGAFHDDGRFHPLPADALPRDVFHGVAFDEVGSETATCHLLGEAVAGAHIGVAASAAAKAPVWRMPRAALRDVYYGELGPRAVSVAYRRGRVPQTLAVHPPLGAYLLVTRTSARQQRGYDTEGLGTPGQLAPGSPLTAIRYRAGQGTCLRLPPAPPWVVRHVSGLCPEEHYARSRPPQPQGLHRPVHVKLKIEEGRVISARVSFVAPYAVTGARDEYSVEMPVHDCGRGVSERAGMAIAGQTIARNVRAGTTVSVTIADPFVENCGHRSARSARVEVSYGGRGLRTQIGSATILRPPGTHPTPLPRRRRGR